MIDIESSINKDKTAVLRVFAKMFYTHLGYYGENLKVAMLEHYIAQNGKTEEFHRIFEKKKGKPWVEIRKAFAFNGKFIITTLMEVLDMSEEDSKQCFNDKTAIDFSISQLVKLVLKPAFLFHHLLLMKLFKSVSCKRNQK